MKKQKEITIPKPVTNKQLKIKLVTKLVKKYSTPIIINDKTTYEPTKKEIEEYLQLIKPLKIKELQLMGSMKDYQLKLDIGDRLKSINKKKHAVVTIFNDNKTSDTGVIHCYDRTFSRNDMTYIVQSHKFIYDPEFKMAHIYYYANMPFPITFDKNLSPESEFDGKLMDSIVEMKVIEALANIDMDKKVNLILMFVLVILAASIATLLICLKGFEFI